MARQIHRLSAKGVASESEPGMHADGGGLYLRITSGRKGGRRWVFLYRRPGDGKRCEMGLGGAAGAAAVSLAKARENLGPCRAGGRGRPAGRARRGEHADVR